MTSVDLDRLCRHLSSIAVDELYSLGDEDSLCVPQIRGHPVTTALAVIRVHITGIQNAKNRLSSICAIYSCLMAKKLIRPWVLYHVPRTKGATEVTLVMRYMMQMDTNRGFAHSMNIKGGTTDLCALVPESDAPSAGHELYCFYFWESLACVAVYRPPEGYSDAEDRVLRKMFGGDPKDFEHGTYDDLDLAHQAATRLAKPPSS